jgi:hypothetical protein
MCRMLPRGHFGLRGIGNITYISGLQRGVREDILGGMRKHLTGYVNIGEKKFSDKY